MSQFLEERDVPVHEGRSEEVEARGMKDVLQGRQLVKVEKESETAREKTLISSGSPIKKVVLAVRRVVIYRSATSRGKSQIAEKSDMARIGEEWRRLQGWHGKDRGMVPYDRGHSRR